MHHHGSSPLMDILMLVIPLQYGIIAVLLAWSVASIPRHRRHIKGIIAMGSFSAVFIFCGLSGYLSARLEWATGVREALHVVLACLTTVFIITAQPAVIASLLTTPEDGSGSD